MVAGKPPLIEGVGIWLWPGKSQHWPHDRWPEARDVAAELQSLGVAYVIPHAGRNSGRVWCTPERIKAFNNRGIKVLIGLGLDGTSGEYVKDTAQAIILALKTPGVHGVVLDWEGRWDRMGAEGLAVADRVLREVPDAADRIVDAPWWAPLTTPSGNSTHPGAPTVGFGKLARTRFVQAYGANVEGSPDGASLRMLAWARDPSQYAKIARKAGVAPWEIRGAFQAYHRSTQDILDTLLREPTQLLWSWTEMSNECITALKLFKALKARGLLGVNAVREFQASSGLKVDGVVGPLTTAALLNVRC